MPAGDGRMEGHVPDLYARAHAARQQALRLAGELAESRRKTTECLQLIQDARAERAWLLARRAASRRGQDRLRYSPYARLQARLASMPVIEQAKGILMAQYGWPEDRSFAALRQVSQQENIKVRDLAASIVARTARGGAWTGPTDRRSADSPRRGGEFILLTDSGDAKTRHRASA